MTVKSGVTKMVFLSRTQIWFPEGKSNEEKHNIKK